MKFRSLLAVLTALVLFAAACDDGEGTELSTTSSVVTGTTEVPDADTTTTTADSGEATTSTTLVGENVSSHEVAARLATEEGEILYVIIPPGAYTDVDLVNFVGDLKEGDADIWGLELFDDPEAAEAYVVPEDQRTEEHQELLDDHHFLSLTRGNRIDFKGPFSDVDDFILAS